MSNNDKNFIVDSAIALYREQLEELAEEGYTRDVAKELAQEVIHKEWPITVRWFNLMSPKNDKDNPDKKYAHQLLSGIGKAHRDTGFPDERQVKKLVLPAESSDEAGKRLYAILDYWLESGGEWIPSAQFVALAVGCSPQSVYSYIHYRRQQGWQIEIRGRGEGYNVVGAPEQKEDVREQVTEMVKDLDDDTLKALRDILVERKVK